MFALHGCGGTYKKPYADEEKERLEKAGLDSLDSCKYCVHLLDEEEQKREMAGLDTLDSSKYCVHPPY